MKKIYLLICAAFLFGATNAQVLLIDEDFDDWNPTGTPGFTVNTYGNWDYTSPGTAPGQAWPFLLRNVRQPSVIVANRLIDIHTDVETTGPGQMIFTVPSSSRIDITIRSASNIVIPEPDRWMYIAREVFGTFMQVSALFPAIPVDLTTYSDNTNVVVDVPVTFALMTRRAVATGGAARLERLQVWSHPTPTAIEGVPQANLIIYTTPRNIRIGGDVVSVEVINLTGAVVKRSVERGIQSIPTDGMQSGIYIVKATDGNGLVKVERVAIR